MSENRKIKFTTIKGVFVAEMFEEQGSADYQKLYRAGRKRLL